MPHQHTTVTNLTTSIMMTPAEPTITTKKRYPVPTPPPCSSSASPVVELAPMLDYRHDYKNNGGGGNDVGLLVDNRPPSPDSPRLKKLDILFHPHHLVHHPHQQQQQQQPPAYLEPTPQLNEPTSKLLFPLNLLFTSSSSKIPIASTTTTPTKLQIPIPCRRTVVVSPSPPLSSNHYHQKTTRRPIITTSTSPPPSLQQQQQQQQVEEQQQGPMSPTMIAASASAAAAANDRNPGSHVAKSLLKGVAISTIDSYQQPLNHKKQLNNSPEQSMFLTKNAHIKRPRNAWIHFRCHYGQALKAQDPTLRAEEISKRASRRWGKLTENEKRPWHGLAEQEKLAHREAFPEYRYCPRRATTTTTTTSSNSSTTSSSPPAPSPMTGVNRPRSNTTTSDHYDLYPASFRPQKKVKRNSK